MFMKKEKKKYFMFIKRKKKKFQNLKKYKNISL